MKKIFMLLGILVILTVFFTGCGSNNSVSEEAKPQQAEVFEEQPKETSTNEKGKEPISLKEIGNRDVYLYVDPDTGVNYLIHSEFRHGGGMTVRVDANGNPIVTNPPTKK